MDAPVGAPRTTMGDFCLRPCLGQPSLNRACLCEAMHQIEPKVMDVLVFLARHAAGLRFPFTVPVPTLVAAAVGAQTFTALDNLGRFRAQVYGINERGETVGRRDDAAGSTRGFLLTPGRLRTHRRPGHARNLTAESQPEGRHRGHRHRPRLHLSRVRPNPGRPLGG